LYLHQLTTSFMLGLNGSVHFLLHTCIYTHIIHINIYILIMKIKIWFQHCGIKYLYTIRSIKFVKLVKGKSCYFIQPFIYWSQLYCFLNSSWRKIKLSPLTCISISKITWEYFSNKTLNDGWILKYVNGVFSISRFSCY